MQTKWQKVLERDVNKGKERKEKGEICQYRKNYVSNSASALQLYLNSLRKFHRNQSRLKIDLIDMYGT